MPATTGRELGGGNAALISIYIATALLSEILTNNAAGAIMVRGLGAGATQEAGPRKGTCGPPLQLLMLCPVPVCSRGPSPRRCMHHCPRFWLTELAE